MSLEERCRDLVAALHIAPAEAVEEVEALTGGVASDIARVRVGGRDICVKFALPKLKVAEDWHAPVHRNAAEYAWLQVASAIAPEGSVKLFGRSEAQHGFAMEFLSGDDVFLWKSALLQGQIPEGAAAKVGDLVGRVHAVSARPGFDTAPFQNRDDFRALRIEPYLTFTAGRHPDLAVPLNALADQLYASSNVLVHGDVSPKNVLFRSGHPVILDAECATMGSPAFDPAFCLNHLVLKAIHLPRTRAALLDEARALWAGYAVHIDFEPPDELEARTAALLPGLMLARIDGKSPVEYLNEDTREIVRQIACPLIKAPASKIDDVLTGIADHLKEHAS